jgi:hypothetical protein
MLEGNFLRPPQKKKKKNSLPFLRLDLPHWLIISFWIYSVLGAILIVAGLYAVLWGKHKEQKEKEAEIIPEPIKENGENGDTTGMIQDIEANNCTEKQRNQANNVTVPSVAITVPTSQAPMTAREAPRA